LIPYWILFAVYAAGSLEFRRIGAIGSRSGLLLGIVGFATALMIGMRYQVGGDWFVYEEIFESTSYLKFFQAIGWSGDYVSIQEPGYSLVNWLAARMGFSVWFVNLACALIFCWGLVKFANRQPNPWLAVTVAIPYLVIVVAMGYTRQAVAIGFILAGLAVVDRTTILRFIGYIVCAVLFHKSAILVLPLVALAATRQRVIIFPMMFVSALLLYYLFVQAAVEQLVGNYIEAEYQSEGAAIRVAMNVPPAAIFLLFHKRFQLEAQQMKLWRNFALAALGALVILMFTAATTAVDRLALYLIPLQLFVFARLPLAFGNKGIPNRGILVLVLAYSAFVQFVWLNFATHSEYWIPYKVYPILGDR
jgi:hypothetical protein